MIYFENIVAIGVIAMTKKSIRAVVINLEAIGWKNLIAIGWKNLIAIGWFFYPKKKKKYQILYLPISPTPIYLCSLTYVLKWSISKFSYFMCIFNLLLYFLDLAFELQNRLMKKLLFRKIIYLFLNFFDKKINLLQWDFFNLLPRNLLQQLALIFLSLQ